MKKNIKKVVKILNDIGITPKVLEENEKVTRLSFLLPVGANNLNMNMYVDNDLDKDDDLFIALFSDVNDIIATRDQMLEACNRFNLRHPFLKATIIDSRIGIEREENIYIEFLERKIHELLNLFLKYDDSFDELYQTVKNIC